MKRLKNWAMGQPQKLSGNACVANKSCFTINTRCNLRPERFPSSLTLGRLGEHRCQPTDYKFAAACSSAFVVIQMYRIFWIERTVQFVLVRHWLSVMGSNVG